ncbi:MAG: RagB/SusD family nutrient uptake outer membrane protein [Prolixibacteraceae bacterium]
MKRIKLIIIVGLLTFFMGSCNYLDYSEVSYLHEENVFADWNRTQNFLADIYSRLPLGFTPIGGAMSESATDDAEFVLDYSSIQKFNDGSWSSILNLDDQWSNMYAGIRAVNLFLDEIKGRTFSDYKWIDTYADKMAQFNNYPQEARFLRAYFYFQLIIRYGDVPLIKTVLTEAEANTVTPASFDDIVSFIVSECNDIIPLLPVTYVGFTSAQETGRIRRGAAMALKARTLLYAASPLHNPSGTTQKWIDAAKAAKDLINAGTFSLEANYNNFLNNVTSPELILDRREGNQNYFEVANFPVGYEGGNTGNCPTQNLIDAYEMRTNGLSIADPNSGYSAANPYANRDPRFALTILYNTSTFKSKAVECWIGGANAYPKTNATKTGYYLKKYVIESVSLDPNSTSTKQHTWVLFRYGEVLLNYAESMNEAYGPEDASTLGMTALQAVNLIRTRAKMPLFPAGLTKDQFRLKLQNERRIELAFEGQRFWDVRRWKIGSTTKNIYGMDITKNTDGTFNYSKKLVESRVYEDKMNLYPIPLSELYKNNKLKQNTGW